MAVTVSTLSPTFVSRDTTAHTVAYLTNGSYSGNELGYTVRTRNLTVSGYGTATIDPDTTAASGSFSSASATSGTAPSALAADTTYPIYAWINHEYDGDVFGSTLNFKTAAEVATASAPSVGSITASSASVSCDFVAKVSASTCTAQLQYKRTVDSTWTNFGTAKTDGTGYGTSTIGPQSLTGLTHSTAYDVRLVLTRTTANDTSTTSATTSFNTLVGEPDVTTDAVSAIAATTATLNATVTVNAGTNVTVYWKYGTDNPPTQFTTSSQAVSGDGSFSQGISSLSSSTLYYVQAYVAFDTPSGSPNSGSVASFTTAADPLAEAAEEDHVRIFYFDRKYGVSDAVTFVVPDVASSSSDRFFNTTAPFASGDVKISIDGGAVANTTNLPTRIGSTPLFTLTLTAAELQGSEIDVYLVDADGPAWRDTLLKIRTELLLGNVQIDAATGTKANTSAVVATGYGSGHGISAVAGATGLDFDGVFGQHVQRFNTATAGGASTITLDASASSTNDYYNGSLIMIVSGTGAGQARVITDYVGSTQVATVNKSWATNPASGSVFIIIPGDDPWKVSPAAELSALPTYASNYADLLQFIFQRFVYKRTQTATTFTMYKDDGSTSLTTAGVSDDGTTQTHNELA